MLQTVPSIDNLLAVCLFGCGRFSNEEAPQDHKERTVCISKQYTEIIYALGAQNDIIAVDISSTYPEAAKKLPTVGYHRALSVEAGGNREQVLSKENIKRAYQLEPVIHRKDESMYLFFE